MGGDKSVRLRVPIVVVNAVQNSGYGLRPPLEHAFETKTEFRGLDFLAIFPANGGDQIRVRQRAFQKIDVAEILHLRNREQVPGQHEEREYLRWKQPLISHVVNGEDRPGVLERRIFHILGPQQHRNHGRLPVVTVKNIGHPENLRALNYRPAKQREALGIVRKITRAGAVKAIAIEVGWIVNEKETD